VIRTAFTMIELLFAIVIISISVVSIPVMTQITARGVEENIKQEAIFAASAKVMQVLSYPWDEASIDLNNSTSMELVVDIGANTGIYARKSIAGANETNQSFRIGHIRQDNHRKMFTYDNNMSDDGFSSFVTNLGDDDGNSTGMDEQSGSYAFSNVLGSASGYKDSYTNVVNVGYIADTGAPFMFSQTVGTTPTNMKVVQVRIDGRDGEITTLYAYSANIGEVELYSRRYP